MRRGRKRNRRKWRARIVRGFVILACAVAAWFLSCCAVLVALRWIDPPTTAVQVERRVASWFRDAPYAKQARFVPLSKIADDLEWAVVAAEDSRFFEHGGVDWNAVRVAAEEATGGGRVRGASTITQQLVKNLFLTTRRSWLRKAAEVPLAYAAETALPKRRILELYLNVVEWGDGVYGAEAAARRHFGTSAAALTRDESARLAACLPDPRRRRPRRMDRYSEIIQERMAILGR